jgi:hypothetical protein
MKNTMLVGLLCAAIGAPAIAGDDSYAIAAYNAGTTETVYVYGPLPTNCDAARLDAIRKVQQTIVPPSLVEIGYACATRDQIAKLNLNPPICELVNGDTYASGGSGGWAYVCYRGIVDRFVKNHANASLAHPASQPEPRQSYAMIICKTDQPCKRFGEPIALLTANCVDDMFAELDKSKYEVLNDRIYAKGERAAWYECAIVR